MRHSKQRDLILSVLKECQDHPTADVIYERVKAICPSISLGTVYRNLKQFVEDGRAISLETTDISLHYDGRVASHGHFVCQDCGKIIDVFEDFLLPQTLINSGVKINDTKVIFYGKCTDCLQK